MIDYPPPVRQRLYHEALSEPRRPWWIAALALVTFAVSTVIISVLLSFAAVELDRPAEAGLERGVVVVEVVAVARIVHQRSRIDRKSVV